MKIDKYGICLRLVEEHDAEFIVRLRTDEKLSRFLSLTSNDVDAQKRWIQKYKEREQKEQEYYFVALYQDVIYGTTRIYNIESDCFEVGSWLFSPETPSGVAVLADIIGREFAFEKFNTSKCKFEVRRKNASVVKYHKSYKPLLIKETEQDLYFLLNRSAFEEHKTKLIKLLSK